MFLWILLGLSWCITGSALMKWRLSRQEHKALRKEYVQLVIDTTKLKQGYNSYAAGWKAALRNPEAVFRAHRELVTALRERVQVKVTKKLPMITKEDLG